MRSLEPRSFEYFAMHKPECRSHIDRCPSWNYIDMALVTYWSNSSYSRVISDLTWSSNFALNFRSAPQPSRSSSIRASTSRYAPDIQFKSSETNQGSRVPNARNTGKPVPQSFESIDRLALQQSQKRLEVLSSPYPLLSSSNSLGLGTRWEGRGRERRLVFTEVQNSMKNLKYKIMHTSKKEKYWRDKIVMSTTRCELLKAFWKITSWHIPENCLHMKVTKLFQSIPVLTLFLFSTGAVCYHEEAASCIINSGQKYQWASIVILCGHKIAENFECHLQWDDLMHQAACIFSQINHSVQLFYLYQSWIWPSSTLRLEMHLCV